MAEKRGPYNPAAIYGYAVNPQMLGVNTDYSYTVGEFDSGDYGWKDIYKSLASGTAESGEKARSKQYESGTSESAPPIPQEQLDAQDTNECSPTSHHDQLLL